jgi:hypothetical protein
VEDAATLAEDLHDAMKHTGGVAVVKGNENKFMGTANGD